MKNNIEIKVLDKKDLTSKILKNLKVILDEGYYESRMYQKLLNDLERNNKFFKAFVAFLDEKLVGIMVLKDYFHGKVNYYNYQNIHINRVCVDSNYRNLGIGQKLLIAVKDYAFSKADIKVIFVTSGETGAMKFYINNGALVNKQAILNYSEANSGEENSEHFREFLTNKKFRNYRLANGNCVDFVYCKDKSLEENFRKKGYFGAEFLLNN